MQLKSKKLTNDVIKYIRMTKRTSQNVGLNFVIFSKTNACIKKKKTIKRTDFLCSDSNYLRSFEIQKVEELTSMVDGTPICEW